MYSYTNMLSTGASTMRRSVMRDLLKLTADPQIISLAGGLPANELLPVDEFRDCLNSVLKREGANAMQYRPQYRPLKEWIAGYMQTLGVFCQPDNVFITNGNQQGLTILSRLFLDPGQPVVIEEITFTGIQQATSGMGAEVRAIPVDLLTGADDAALEEAFRQYPRPRFAVLIPDFHNPLGVSLSAEKRSRVAALAAEYGVPLIEDNPYIALRFEGEALPPIKAYDEQGVVFFLGSFSKMLAPGVRLGWIVAPTDLIPKITVLRESIDLESSALMQRAVHEFVQRGMLEPHLEQLTFENLMRRDTMLNALEESLGSVATWTHPEGGLFVWVTLPEHIDTTEMLQEAVQRQVAYVPGSPFAVAGGFHNTMRLNFSSVTPPVIREGIARLAEVVLSHC
jgi:2-aminoadipate transaminase